jgi:hydrogenase maturation protease
VTSRPVGHLQENDRSAPRRLAPRAVVIGMGSEWRRDDGIGLAVAASVARRATGEAFANCHIVTRLADPLDLLAHWDGADLAVVVDATRSRLAPGTVSRMVLERLGDELVCERGIEDPSVARRAAGSGRAPSSTHGLGLAGVLRLARAVECAPARLVVVGVEGGDFGPGSELTPAVAAAIDEAAVSVIELVEQAFACA